MNTLLIVLIVLAAIALILVVLVQESKGGGLSSSFSSSNAIMGVRKTTAFIEKATWGLAIFIAVLSIVCVIIRPRADVAKPQTKAPIEAPAANTVPNMNSTLPLLKHEATGTTAKPAQPAQQGAAATTTPVQTTKPLIPNHAK